MRTALIRYRWLIAVVLVAVTAATALIVHVVSGEDCDECLLAPGGSTIEAKVKVIGESGDPLAGARVTLHGIAESPVVLTADTAGVVDIPPLSGPASAVVEADGHIVEPMTIGWSDSGQEVSVRLFAHGPNRFAMHSGGDVMFGGRYAAPAAKESADGSAAVNHGDAAVNARQVVAAVAPTFGAADLRTVNLENVISGKPAEAAYPGKRFINQDPATGTVAGLQALSVDVAVLANDHARDLLDGGIADTRAALTAANIAAVGAGADAASASAPVNRTVNGVPVTVLAYTGVDGSFANSGLPDVKVRKPVNLPETDNWWYDARTWGFAEAKIATAPRRIRAAWEQFTAAESRVGADVAGRMWASLTQVYPETQDWVARRGHGGAAPWDGKRSEEQIRASSDGVTVVQVHGGAEFQDAASADVRQIARKAIDAGADIVVAHHPHVLQGVEWYKGRLIAYSMGNLVYDENILSTFSSAFLRTVWEGDKLLEARLLPIEIVDHKPVPVTDRGAVQVLTRVYERSALTAESYVDGKDDVRARTIERGPDDVPAKIVIERHTGRITADPPAERNVTVSLGPRETVDLGDVPVGALVRPGPGAGVDIGRELFGWGGFEDESADGVVSEAIHWSLDGSRKGAQPGQTPQGLRFLRMQARGDAVQTRTIARVSLPRHRLYTERGGQAVGADPVPSYSIIALMRRATAAVPEMRFEVHHFDDSDPGENPLSQRLAGGARPIDIPADGEWHRVVIDLTTADLDGPVTGNMILPYFRVDTDKSGRTAWLDIDDVRVVEWRSAEGMTGVSAPFTMARNRGDTATECSLLVRESR